MEATPVVTLLDNISQFKNLPSVDGARFELNQRYLREIEELSRILESILEVIVSSQITVNEDLEKMLNELDVSIDEAKEAVGRWNHTMSKLYYVLECEPRFEKVQTSILLVCRHLGPSFQLLEMVSSFECIKQCVQKIEPKCYEEVSDVINLTIADQIRNGVPGSKYLVKIADCLGLSSNLELLMEVASLIMLRTKVAHGKVDREIKYIDQMIALVNHMQACYAKDHLVRNINGVQVPVDLCCPLSLQIMSDPVIVESGQTYERAFIQKWIDQGFTLCPKTWKTLGRTNLIPNSMVKNLTTSWFGFNKNKYPESANLVVNRSSDYPAHENRDMNLPPHSTPRSLTSSEVKLELSEIEIKVNQLVKDLQSSSIDLQACATSELHHLTRNSVENRIIIAECGAINHLIGLLHSSDLTVQENAVTTLLNLSLNDNNRMPIANAGAIGPLIHVLRTGSQAARNNAAASLYCLSKAGDNRARIGQSGAMGPLVELLRDGTPEAKKDAMSALLSLSLHPENNALLVQAGIVRSLVNLMNPAIGVVDKAVVILANLTGIAEGRDEIAHCGGINALVDVIELGSMRGKENAAAALWQLCTDNNRGNEFRNMVLHADAVPLLKALADTGTPRAKGKALSLLGILKTQRRRARRR